MSTLGRTQPHNLDAEMAVIGGLLNGHSYMGDVFEALSPDDFYRPGHAVAFDVLHRIWKRGDRIQLPVVWDELQRAGAPLTEVQLAEIAANGSAANVAAYCDIVTRLAVARKVEGAALDIVDAARAGTLDPAELMDLATGALTGLDVPVVSGDMTGLSTVDDFLATAETTPSPWVVPGLLRSGWRCMVVAPEGVGKSVAFRQIALASAAGVHPFTHTPIPPVRTLIVDLENPDDAIAETCRPITDKARSAGEWDQDRAWLWRRPGGLDLRGRTDRAALTSVLAMVRPQLVCLGPLYKAYRTSARESDELAAGEVQGVLDDLRTRFGFALLLEHHAPKRQGIGERELSPYGSSLWMRWPELGLKLEPGNGENWPKDSLRVGRWRRDRMRHRWPDRLDRGGEGRWPWVGYYTEGMS